MSDVIIAIVPAPGHEGLVATWMPQGFRGTVERPARVIRCSCGAWACPVMADGHMLTHDDALILHAPGGPRLGMVRARAACQGDPKREEIDQFINDLPFGTMSEEALGIWCFAHLMRVRGLASEVLVLPVPS